MDMRDKRLVLTLAADADQCSRHFNNIPALTIFRRFVLTRDRLYELVRSSPPRWSTHSGRPACAGLEHIMKVAGGMSLQNCVNNALNILDFGIAA